MGAVVEVTDQTFEEEVLNSEKPTEVDFWAPWCGPCRMVGPVYDKLAQHYDTFKFCKINVDESTEVAQRYGIQSIPTQMFFADGERVDEILGAAPEATIKAKVEEVLAKHPSDTRGRLKSILSSWTKHNSSSAEKFHKWEERAEDMKTDASYNSTVMAVREMEEASRKLSQLIGEL